MKQLQHIPLDIKNGVSSDPHWFSKLLKCDAIRNISAAVSCYNILVTFHYCNVIRLGNTGGQLPITNRNWLLYVLLDREGGKKVSMPNHLGMKIKCHAFKASD
jgi:hypothetical protein